MCYKFKLLLLTLHSNTVAVKVLRKQPTKKYKVVKSLSFDIKFLLGVFVETVSNGW